MDKKDSRFKIQDSRYLVVLGVIMISFWGLSSEFDRLKLVLSPIWPRSYVIAAQEAAKMGDYAIAEELVSEYEKITKTPLSPIEKEKIFPKITLERSLSEIDAKLEKQPTAVEWLLEKIRVLVSLKRNDEAKRILEKIEKLDPNNTRVQEVVKQLRSLL